jgi:hypothetical protein
VSGPLAGLRVIELASLGSVPLCGQLLSDLGADVIRIDRLVPSWTSGVSGDPAGTLSRGRRSVAVDLKSKDDVEVVLRLAAEADALIEGFRPGVVERMGIGPDQCRGRNARLVYGRCSGWAVKGHSPPGFSGKTRAVPHDGEPLQFLELVGTEAQQFSEHVGVVLAQRRCRRPEPPAPPEARERNRQAQVLVSPEDGMLDDFEEAALVKLRIFGRSP